MMDTPALAWRKSSFSGGGQGSCVEVAPLPGRLAVRDSKDPSGPILDFDMTDWAAFVTDLRDNRL